MEYRLGRVYMDDWGYQSLDVSFAIAVKLWSGDIYYVNLIH